ncbi:MAG: hypothetical protein WKF94_05735 [Solirubrobacteraceae bacterium]
MLTGAVELQRDAGSAPRELGLLAAQAADPVGRLLFNVLAMVAEFESDLIRMRS